MIVARFEPLGFLIVGHADQEPDVDGYDLICGMVTAVSTMAVNGLDVAGAKYELAEGSGLIHVDFHLGSSGKLLVHILVMALQDIERLNPKALKVVDLRGANTYIESEEL